MATVNGSLTFEAAGARHTLRYGINALCEMEARLGTTVGKIGELMAAGLSMQQLRTVFACGLETPATDQEAGVLIDEIGLARAGDLVGEAMQAAFPEADGAKSSPRKAAAGTGSTS